MRRRQRVGPVAEAARIVIAVLVLLLFGALLIGGCGSKSPAHSVPTPQTVTDTPEPRQPVQSDAPSVPSDDTDYNIPDVDVPNPDLPGHGPRVCVGHGWNRVCS